MLHRLRDLEREIRLVTIGIGSVGRAVSLQTQITPGIHTVALADIELERAIACAEWLGRDYEVVETANALHDAIRRGKLAVSADGQLVARCELADVMMESSSDIFGGAEHAALALQHGMHAVLMNYEAALAYGPYLRTVAQKHGRVVTCCDGDQPAVLKRMIDDLRFWGFELVMAGNIKGYLDLDANPTTIVPEADKRQLDYRMCTSYTDGSKLGVEMAILANSLGMRVTKPGMQGPRSEDIREVFKLFDFETLWQERKPVVDYVLGGEPKGGVFVVGFTEDRFQQFSMDWFPMNLGKPPFYMFYRPYHLVHMEALQSVVEAFLDHRPVLEPGACFHTNVYAYAKQPLQAGEELDGFGGYTCYGVIENATDNEVASGLPLCLSEGVRLRRNVAKGEKILLQDVDYDADGPPFAMYQLAQQQAGQTSRIMEPTHG